MTVKWNYKKVNEHQKFLPDNFGSIAYMLCEQLTGQSDANWHDIKVCEEVAAIEVVSPRGKSSMYCKDHANAFFLELPPMFSQATS